MLCCVCSLCRAMLCYTVGMLHCMCRLVLCRVVEVTSIRVVRISHVPPCDVPHRTVVCMASRPHPLHNPRRQIPRNRWSGHLRCCYLLPHRVVSLLWLLLLLTVMAPLVQQQGLQPQLVLLCQLQYQRTYYTCFMVLPTLKYGNFQASFFLLHGRLIWGREEILII